MKNGRKWVGVWLVASCLSVLSCSTIGSILSPATATPTAEPFPAADEMVGTHWTIGYYIQGEGRYEHEIVFRENGRLEFHHPNDTTPDNDSWEMAGSQVILSINNSYVTYTGSFVDADTITGIAVNIKNVTWEWTARRIN